MEIEKTVKEKFPDLNILVTSIKGVTVKNYDCTGTFSAQYLLIPPRPGLLLKR
jgi:hypothetical protein